MHSKFVNTKTGQRGAAKKDPLQFPIFERSKNHNQFQKPPQAELERLTQEQAKTVEMPKPILEQPLQEDVPEAKEVKIHGSINLEKMQEMEDLNKADEDWLAFFLGKKEPIVYSESTELATIPSSFAESVGHGPIIPPPPAQEIQESNIFEESSFSEEAQIIAEAPKSENCLNNIFDEMISDDHIFSRSATV